MTFLFDLLAPIGIFLEHPGLALVPALVFLAAFAVLHRGGRRRGLGLVLAAAISWAGYAVYESYMHRWSLTVSAPIRVDLVFVVPALWLLTAGGLCGCVVAARGGSR
jgi:hypothetical protein